MSCWTYINGVITVAPMGRTQAEKRYILETVLDHLPIVTGMERDMDVYVIQKNGESSISSCDEFGYTTNNLISRDGFKSRNGGWLKCQDEYILVVNGNLRNRDFHRTFKEFNKWLCRLSKRVIVKNIMVDVDSDFEGFFFKNEVPYRQMFETPSWVDENSYNWCEYLMWERGE